MIGHFLLQLTPEQEDRVLTENMGPHLMGAPVRARCLLQRCANSDTYWNALRGLQAWGMLAFKTTAERSDAHVGYRYDYLCLRFGTPRINAAIRNRILSQRAYRTLSVGASVEVHP